MRRKDFYKRTWLNPRGQTSMSVRADIYGAQLSIRDCGERICLHSGHMDSSQTGYKKERNAFLRKIRLVREMIDTLESEVLDRWQ